MPHDPSAKPPINATPASPTTLAVTPAPSDNIEPASDARRNTSTSSDPNRSATTDEKRRFPQRLNPTTWFRAKGKPAPITTPLDPSPRRESTPLPPSPSPARGKQLAKSETGTSTKPTSEPKSPAAVSSPSEEQPAAPPVPRYPYLSPTKPALGDRGRAEQALARGVSAHSQRELSAALNAYREAVRLDPSLFEAQSRPWTGCLRTKGLAPFAVLLRNRVVHKSDIRERAIQFRPRVGSGGIQHGFGRAARKNSRRASQRGPSTFLGGEDLRRTIESNGFRSSPLPATSGVGTAASTSSGHSAMAGGPPGKLLKPWLSDK